MSTSATVASRSNAPFVVTKLVIVLLSALLVTAIPSKSEAGLLRGGLIGAASGALFGGIIGGGRGAAAGAIVGGVTGTVIGANRARHRRAYRNGGNRYRYGRRRWECPDQC